MLAVTNIVALAFLPNGVPMAGGRTLAQPARVCVSRVGLEHRSRAAVHDICMQAADAMDSADSTPAADTAPAPAPPSPASAYIEFIRGVTEPVVPDVKLTRSRDGSTGVATFTFDNPSFLAAESSELGETTGMYLNDEEGELRTSEVTATFVNGKPRIVKGVIVMRGPGEWDRFMRFMERYAEANGLGFSKA